MLHRGSNCSLAQAVDDRIIMRCGIISSCQSAATSEIVKSAREHVFIVEQRYIKYRTIYVFTFIQHNNNEEKQDLSLKLFSSQCQRSSKGRGEC